VNTKAVCGGKDSCNWQLEDTDTEKDFGIIITSEIITSNLKASQQCSQVCAKADIDQSNLVIGSFAVN